MDISKQKKFLLSEIKVINPLRGKLSLEDFEDYKDRAYDQFFNYGDNIPENELEEFNRYKTQIELTNTIKEIDEALLWLYSGDQGNVDAIKNGLQEDNQNFEVGKTTQTKTGKHTITDVNPITGSVTWTINKKIKDEDIYHDLSLLITKLESYKEEYYNEKRLNSLLQKIKFIRNTFSRTSKK